MKRPDTSMRGTRGGPGRLLWPDGRNIAVIFDVAYEAWSPSSASSVGPMGNALPAGLFDPNADSYGRYGAQTGIYRLVGLLDRAGISANVYVSGLVAEQDPASVKAIAEAGHEIAAHGYAQDLIPVTLSSVDDELSICRSTEILAGVTGVRPTGWMSPRVTSGPNTRRHLARHGYTWHCDALDADLPYLEEYPEGSLMAIPLSVEFNDLAHTMRFGRTPGQFVENFRETVGHMFESERETIIIDVLVHAHCYGRPAGAWAFGEILQDCANRDCLRRVRSPQTIPETGVERRLSGIHA